MSAAGNHVNPNENAGVSAHNDPTRPGLFKKRKDLSQTVLLWAHHSRGPSEALTLHPKQP